MILRAKGWEATEVVAYHTVPLGRLDPAARRRLDGGEVDWVAFTASSTVEGLPPRLRRPAPARASGSPPSARSPPTPPAPPASRWPPPPPSTPSVAWSRPSSTPSPAELPGGSRVGPFRRTRRCDATCAVSGGAAAEAAAEPGAAGAGPGERAVAAGPGGAAVREGGHLRGGADRLHARPCPAHAGEPAQGGGRAGRARHPGAAAVRDPGGQGRRGVAGVGPGRDHPAGAAGAAGPTWATTWP